MKKESILCALVAASSLSIAAQDLNTAKLVVGIVVDELRTDYLEAFSPLYGDDGLKKLMNKGIVYTNVQYASKDVDRASSIASIYTGSVPYIHGIIGEDWMDRNTSRPIHCTDDYTIKSINSYETASPKYLLVSTIGDELKLATENKAHVISIAPNREQAVLSIGHAADYALWLDNSTGQWASSCYYNDNPPSWLKFLDNKSIKDCSSISWKPINEAAASYNYYLCSQTKGSFNHSFKSDRRYRLFKQSGLINDYISSAASLVIKQSSMGSDNIADLLSLSYYAGGSGNELQDTYIRLDKAIADLLNEIDKHVGLEHTLIFLTSTGYAKEETDNLSDYKIPTGTFYINRCAALLNLYLNAIYGSGQYIMAYYGNQLYLDHKLIEEKQLSVATILNSCADFLFQYSGIKDVYTSTRLIQGAWTPGISTIRNGYNAKCSGDILLEINPGWILQNEELGQSRYIRDSYLGFPLIFFGLNLEAEKRADAITIDQIAPTISRSIRIRAPNGCSSAPLF